MTTEPPTDPATTTEPPTGPPIGSLMNPTRSCSDIPPHRSCGYYYIQTDNTSSPVQVYCDMNRTSCSCNTTGGWMRVANLDMTDPNQNCPGGFRLVTRTTPPLRTCGRAESVRSGCVSTTYQTHGVEYSHVCGQVIGYQYGSTDVFYQGINFGQTTADSNYVDGISLTHGRSPRKHIWTFAAALDEVLTSVASPTPDHVCPCTISFSDPGSLPAFVGQDYFCATGSRDEYQDIFYPDDPLWDGQGCGGTSTCREFNNPPWFCKQLPQPTTDDIELRICGWEATHYEDTPLEHVEIYVY